MNVIPMADGEYGRSTSMENVVASPNKDRGCCERHKFICCVTLVLMVLISAFIGSVLGALFAVVIKEVEKKIGEHTTLVNGSTAASEFKSSSAPLYTKYWFFNLTNPDDVRKGAKPNFEEVGPFVYKENKTKFNLKWESNGTVLSYSMAINYTYDSGLSTEGDPKLVHITTINVPFMVVASKIQHLISSLSGAKSKEMLGILVKILDYLKYKLTSFEQIFTVRTVDELLFGYVDPMLHLIHKEFPSIVPSAVFAYSNRSTVEEPNRVYTGTNDTRLVAQYIQWNNHTEISGWGTPYARKINGTSGFQFHPGVTRDEQLTVFVDELYRSGYFRYTQDVMVDGIHLYQFELPKDELRNVTQDPGFYANGPSGVLNLTSVAPGNASLFISKPHFLDADPSYLENITGLYPNRTLHDSYLDVEPITGAVLMAEKRIQLNYLLNKLEDFPEMSGVRNVMVPLFYGSEEGTITPHLANEFKGVVYSVKYGVIGVVWGVIGVTALVCVICVFCLVGLVVQHYRRQHYQQLNSDETSPLLSGNPSTNI